MPEEKNKMDSLEMSEISKDEAERISEEASKETQQFVKIDPDSALQLHFTGKIFKREGKFGTVFSFELKEKTKDGQHKIISWKINNPFVRVLISEIKKGNLDLLVHRSGTASETKYSIIKQA